MLSYEATTTINTRPEAIWNILTDAPNYPNWDPNMIRLEGVIAKGNQVKAFTKLDPNRVFPATVTVFEPNKHMTWSGGMPFGLFKGVRTFDLVPEGDQTKFTLREEFSGPLLPLFGRTIPDLTQTFEDFVAGLKSQAEQS